MTAGIPGNLPVRRDRMLRIAQAARGVYTPTSQELILARHMLHDGYALPEIHEALGWPCAIETTRNRLAKFNIKPRWGRQQNRAHLGHVPYLSKSVSPTGTIDTRAYVPNRKDGPL